MKRTALVLLLILGLSVGLYAMTPEEVLKGVRDLSLEKSYTAEIKMESPMMQNMAPTYQQVFARTEADGSQSMRVEINMEITTTGTDAKMAKLMADMSNKVIIVKMGKDNEVTGMWDLNQKDKTAIKFNWLNSFTKNYKDLCPGRSARDLSACMTGAQLTEDKVDGIPCWVVTQAYTQEFMDKVAEAQKKSTDEMMKNLSLTADTAKKAKAPDMFSKGTTLKMWIGKADHMQHRTDQCDASGKTLMSMSYKNIKMGVNLADALFVVPKDYKTLEFNDVQEYMKYMMGEMGKPAQKK